MLEIAYDLWNKLVVVCRSAVDRVVTVCKEKTIKWQENRGIEGISDGELLCTIIRDGFSSEPVLVPYCPVNPVSITGIAYGPTGTNGDSPEVKVISGGVGQKEVILELKNKYNRKWGCKVEIHGFQLNTNPEENKLIVGIRNGYVLYKDTVKKSSTEPYELSFPRFSNHYHNDSVIFGISCLPADTSMDSPEVKIKSGGVGHKKVKLELTNRYKRPWGCKIEIFGCLHIADFQEKNTNPEQNKFKVGSQYGPVLYNETVERISTAPYLISYPQLAWNHDAVIAGIACLPADSSMDFPKIIIKSGGPNCREVKLELKNYSYRKWGCKVIIYGLHASAAVEKNELIVGNRNKTVLYQEIVEKYSTRPYEIFYSCSTKKFITGIACLPIDNNIDSPRTTIKSGGLNSREVQLELKNNYNRKWGCKVVIYGDSDKPN